VKKKIDLSTWDRKEHFLFFHQFEEPFHGVCVTVDVTKTYQKCKEQGVSFFLKYLYLSLKAANETEAFRYRIIDHEVYLFEAIHASPTIARENGLFGFSYMNFQEDFSVFEADAQKVMEETKKSTGLLPSKSGENVIHYSSLPWLSFTSLSHARSFGFADSAPKISFGKMEEKEGTLQMPMSVHVHHGLAFGKDVADYVTRFQELLNLE
tara:strand:+ start:25306 stop:25932 length:627 start_codon:yes stop_codon:yes gene_type:complete